MAPPLCDSYGDVDEVEAARRMQCAWRVFRAKRVAQNKRLKRWYLKKYAMRVQSAWRCFNAKQILRRRREERMRQLGRVEEEYQRRTMASFVEGLLWRMSMCENKASFIQLWYRACKARRWKVGQRALAAAGSGLVAARDDRRGTVASTAGRLSVSGTVVSPHAEEEEKGDELPIPTGCDAVPCAGVLRGPIFSPPPAGTPNVNIRREEREKRELKLLETSALVSRTKDTDHGHALKREQIALEQRAATTIQSMFRRKMASDQYVAASVKRHSHYMKLQSSSKSNISFCPHAEGLS